MWRCDQYGGFSARAAVRRLRRMPDEGDYGHVEIEVEGNVCFENGRLLSEAGANLFVAGASSVFDRLYVLEDAIARLRKSIE
ncbi:MAG: hypothetical protein IJX80_03840 [Clostridia bacterium]|nr:hypothetical protein [Clostridia bacterium]